MANGTNFAKSSWGSSLKDAKKFPFSVKKKIGELKFILMSTSYLFPSYHTLVWGS